MPTLLAPSRFVATVTYDLAVISSLAFIPNCEGSGWVDIDGDGLVDFVCGVAGNTVYWYKQNPSPVRGTFGRRFQIASGLNEVEGVAAGKIRTSDTDVAVVVCDQGGDTVRIYVPTTPGSPTGAWTGGTLVSPDMPHTVKLDDVDGDGHLEIVFCHEGTSSAFQYLDYNGSGAYTTAANWTLRGSTTGNAYRSLIHDGPADFAGNGRRDWVVCQRETGPGNGVVLLKEPADPTGAWTKQALGTAGAFAGGAGWACYGDFSGDGNGLDIASFSIDNGDPRYWTKASGYTTQVALPDPTLSAGWSAWNIFRIPSPDGGRDRIGYIIGNANLTAPTEIHVFAYEGGAWVDRTVLSNLDYGHAMEGPIRQGTGLVTGRSRPEWLIPDSGTPQAGVGKGGSRMAQVTLVDTSTAPTRTAPSVRAASTPVSTGSSPMTITKPTGTQDTDWLVTLITGDLSGATPVITPPSNHYCIAFLMSGTGFMVFAAPPQAHPASVQFSRSGISGTWIGQQVAVQDAATSDPFESMRMGEDTGSNTTFLGSSMQAPEIGMLALIAYQWFTAQSGSPSAYPTGFVEKSISLGTRGAALAAKGLSAMGDTGDLDATGATASATKFFGLLMRGAA